MAGNTLKNWRGTSFHKDGWQVTFTRNLKATADEEEMGGDDLAAQYRAVLLRESYGPEGNQPHLMKDSA
jgi:hypothetical protein